MSQYISNESVKTRKPHQCWGCLETFPIGSTLRRWVGKSDGVLLSLYICPECDAYIAERKKDDRWYGEDGFEQGFVRDDRAEALAWERRMRS